VVLAKEWAVGQWDKRVEKETNKERDLWAKVEGNSMEKTIFLTNNTED
jgi:hypothetical protein